MEYGDVEVYHHHRTYHTYHNQSTLLLPSSFSYGIQAPDQENEITGNIDPGGSLRFYV